jgi:hypothetical protein
MSKRKMLVFAVSLTLLIALIVGGGMGVWAAASNEQEAPPPRGEQDRGEQENERKEEEVPEIPEKIILRFDEHGFIEERDIRHLPYDERPIKQIYPEDADVGFPPELAGEVIVTRVTRGKEECPEFPLPAEPPTLVQLDELLEGVAAFEETPYDERPFKFKPVYPQDAGGTYGNPNPQNPQKAVEPVAVVPIRGTLPPRTGDALGPWFFRPGETMAISVTWTPGESWVSVGILCMATGRVLATHPRQFGSTSGAWTILRAGWYAAVVINHGPHTIVYSGLVDI